MAQFDVHRNPNPATRAVVPYLLNVQSDLLDRLATRVVVPLVRAAELEQAAAQLNPCFEIEGQAVVMSTPELAGVPQRALGERVLSLQHRRDEITAALDLLFTGI
ncbi:MAG: CcdB family protein [Pseudomonadota bacterium]|uniref:CcdB family protein n=1 Tax=Thermithiobacillus tepidarius TaxID=929 RepID=UPI00041143E3|nr:CcdB family protein [Thermithiobacillus tepidarius]